jgi:hypothetical protein
MEVMRSIPLLVIALVGCVSAVQAPRGGTMKEMVGEVTLVFTNASPEPMCELNISLDGKDDHGDNWLPVGGLPSGKSVDFKVKPGKYKAVWATCKKPNKPYYAATRWRDSAVEVTEPTQLFAFIASNRSPTSYDAAPQDDPVRRSVDRAEPEQDARRAAADRRGRAAQADDHADAEHRDHPPRGAARDRLAAPRPTRAEFVDRSEAGRRGARTRCEEPARRRRD